MVYQYRAATKIVFLDFDGPLSNARTNLAFGDIFSEGFDPVTVRALNQLCERTGAKIVCTSRRAMMCDERREESRYLFQDAGFDLTHMHPDWSCNTGPTMKRCEHIQEWLRLHPEVTHYTILDDEYVDIPSHLVQVSARNGVMIDDFERIAMHLGVGMEVFSQHGYSKRYEVEYVAPNIRRDFHMVGLCSDQMMPYIMAGDDLYDLASLEMEEEGALV